MERDSPVSLMTSQNDFRSGLVLRDDVHSLRPPTYIVDDQREPLDLSGADDGLDPRPQKTVEWRQPCNVNGGTSS